MITLPAIFLGFLKINFLFMTILSFLVKKTEIWPKSNFFTVDKNFVGFQWYFLKNDTYTYIVIVKNGRVF